MSALIDIQPLRTADEARACAKIIAESEPWLTLGYGFDAALAALSGSTREIYLARSGEDLIGQIILNMGGAFPGYIQVLVIAPEWRNRGIGETLVRFAEARIFRDYPNVFLCVSDFNTRAQKFYARLGYERVGELKDFLLAGKSEFLMRKTISPKRDFKPTA